MSDRNLLGERWLRLAEADPDVDAVVHCPGGAYPSYAHGHYARDNAFYQGWDAIARDRERFVVWMREHVLETADHAGFLARLHWKAA